MQKPRFDLRPRIQNLRDRTARLRNTQTLGSQVTRLRKTRLRGEYFVPIAAFLLLIIALLFNAYSSRPDDVAITPDNIVPPGTTDIGATATAVVGGVYPGPSGTPLAIGTPLPTGVAVLPGASAYPAPTGDLPLPVGTPIAGGLPPVIDGPVQPPVLLPTSTGVPLGLNTPAVPTAPTIGSTASVASGDGYPPPVTDPSLPNPAALPPTAVIPPTPRPIIIATAPVPPRAVAPLPGVTTLPTATPRVAVLPPTAAPNQRVPTSAPAQAVPTVAVPTTAGGTPVTAPTAEGQPETEEQPTTAGPPTSTPEPTPTPVPPTPTPKPFRRIDGNVRWQAGAPIVLEQDYVIASGAVVQIDPGAEIQVLPGANIFVEGQMVAAGTPNAPVRFVGPAGRWNTLVGQPGSVIRLDQTQIRNAGTGGVAISSTGGRLSLRNVQLADGSGGIVTSGSAVDIQGSQITGNDLRTGPALLVGMDAAPPTVLRGNIIGGNQTPAGTPQVRLVAGPNGSGPLDIQGNALAGGAGPLLDIQTAVPIGGTIRCNGFRSGSVGLQLSASTTSGSGFNLAIDNNAFEQQAVYGVASTVALEAGNNWWGDPSGPFDAERNSQGLGVRAGINVGFQPPLPARPACAPMP